MLEEKNDKNNICISDDASGFVLLTDIVPDVILDIRYYSTYNFIGERIDGYEQPVALMTREGAEALKKVSDEMLGMGYMLKIYDAYRPQMAVDKFVSWAKDNEKIRMKEFFYPGLEKDRLIEDGYIAEKSGHSRGSTVDLTLFDMKENKELDTGGNFDYFGEISNLDYVETLTDEQIKNRRFLVDTMVKHGFDTIDPEWWHFTLKNEPYPNTYFTFPASIESVKK